MTFTDPSYAVFLAIVVATYWLLATPRQNHLLLGASYLFYGWLHPWFLFLLGGVTVVNWACALAIEARPARRRAWLGCAVGLTLGVLALFKYGDFFLGTVAGVARATGAAPLDLALGLLLPVGLSFYTLQALSYTVDVYRGEARAERSLLDVALFVSFFPQLVAGPIERADNLLAAVKRPRTLTAARVESGVLLLAWGFYKKLVVADNLAPIADRVFALQDASFPLLFAGMLAFTLQIYADFSAYTDIARGSAHLLGFDLSPNFDAPYLATSLTDFWRRWHISLTSLLRDYLYLPLAGERPGAARAAAALVTTFAISGLWHGAGWNYVLWGLYHGVLLLFERGWVAMGGRRWTQGRGWLPVKWAVTFLLVGYGLVIFRETGGLAWIVRDLTYVPWRAPAHDWYVARYLCGLVLAYSLPVWLWDAWSRLRLEWPALGVREMPYALRVLAVSALVAGSLTLGEERALSFVYFQF